MTSRCALRCRHCFFWQEAEGAAPHLGLDEIERLSANLRDLLYLVLSGGEPFIRKDLPAICRRLEVVNDGKAVGNLRPLPRGGRLSLSPVSDRDVAFSTPLPKKLFRM